MSNLFNPDFLEFIGLLNQYEVRYIVCGGFAVNIHGHHRSTGDVDIWVDKSPENYDSLMKAFRKFGLPHFDMTLANFLGDKFDVFSFGRPPSGIDIITSLKGLNFEEAFKTSIFYSEEEVEIRVLHKNQLIKAKMSSGRPKDIDDIKNLSD